jgi:hypothetical protein
MQVYVIIEEELYDIYIYYLVFIFITMLYKNGFTNEKVVKTSVQKFFMHFYEARIKTKGFSIQVHGETVCKNENKKIYKNKSERK